MVVTSSCDCDFYNTARGLQSTTIIVTIISTATVGVTVTVIAKIVLNVDKH